MNGFIQWLRQLNIEPLLDKLVIVVAALFCIIIHEISHGLVAYWMGDRTAKEQGRLSLNPLRHIDPFGLLAMVVAGFGWAKPVSVDPRRFRNPKLGMAVTAIAGPVSNMLLAVVIFSVLRLGFDVDFYFLFGEVLYAGGLYGPWIAFLADLLVYMSLLSVGLAVFNLFPIPPLDGSKVLFAVLPDRYYFTLMRYERYGMIVLMILLLTNVLDAPLAELRTELFRILWQLTGVLTGA